MHRENVKNDIMTIEQTKLSGFQYRGIRVKFYSEDVIYDDLNSNLFYCVSKDRKLLSKVADFNTALKVYTNTIFKILNQTYIHFEKTSPSNVIKPI